MQIIIKSSAICTTGKMSNIENAADRPVLAPENANSSIPIKGTSVTETHMTRMKIHDQILQGIQQSEEGTLLDGANAMAALKSKYVQ